MDTKEILVGGVLLSESSAVLVYARQWGQRELIRLRTWFRSKKFGTWYPSRSRAHRFVVERQHGQALAEAILAAVEGKPMPDADKFAVIEADADKTRESRERGKKRRRERDAAMNALVGDN